MYKFVSKTIRESADKLNPALLGQLLNKKFDELKSLLQKIRPIVPSTVREHIDEFIKLIDAKRQEMSGVIQEFIQPVRTVLKVVAKRLDDHAWRVQTYQTNRGWIAPISASGSAKLINAQPPKWAKDLTKEEMKFPALDLKEEKILELMKAHPKHPPLKKFFADTFSMNGRGMRADTITGPAKLYRIIDPSSEGAGMYWMAETEFRKIRNRDEWRSKFAVRPDWNQNGWVVEYEIKAGETLPVWRGPAASQEIPGTNYFLEGGAEQIVFYPSNRDEMIQAMPRIDRQTGQQLTYKENVDRRVDYTDVTGETTIVGLRARITDHHIKGPVETGWGAADYTPQEARKILLTVPE